MFSFRDYHTIQILEGYSASRLPLDTFLRNYLKTHKAIGSKDRNVIARNIYFIIRNLSLIDSFIDAPITWEKRLSLINNQSKLDAKNLPLHIRYSCPKWLFDKLNTQYDAATLEKILKNSLTEAPLTIRVNTIKCSKQHLTDILSQSYKVSDCFFAKNGLKFFKREPLTSHEAFKNGFFEIQDEASQLCCELIQPKPGDLVLDFCAGAGGKSLAIAPGMENKGVLYVHDIRSKAIKEAKKRFERAGIYNVQFFDDQHPLPESLQGKCHYVIVDVPCSGTGTLRRNPDLKWKMSKGEVEKLVDDQKSIFNQALKFLKPGGFIIYSTCSVLKDENQNQVSSFLDEHKELEFVKELVLFPEENGHDGFYACLMQSNKSVNDVCLDDKDRK